MMCSCTTLCLQRPVKFVQSRLEELVKVLLNGVLCNLNIIKTLIIGQVL